MESNNVLAAASIMEEHGRPVFGELTFTPAACLVRYHSDRAQQEFGRLLDLDRVDFAALGL